MARINLIAWDNTRGLSHDLYILSHALEALGHQVYLTNAGPKRRHGAWQAYLQKLWVLLRRLLNRSRQSTRYDLNIMLEHVRPAYIGLAKYNVLIPNPEWFSDRDRQYLDRFDAIFTKTQVANKNFMEEGIKTIYIGFASIDRYLPEVTRDAGVFLHLAGASRMKGTERLLSVWRRHPEWPCLRVFQAKPNTKNNANLQAVNIEQHIGYIDNPKKIIELQNNHVFHLCMSETEGWGHYIVEAMSCASVVITCDAPPMNELVASERGILINAQQTSPLNAALRYSFEEKALEAAIEKAIAMNEFERNLLGKKARHWFLKNNTGFQERLASALKAVL